MAHILIVEDDADISGLMRAVLSKAGWSVEVCRDGPSGIAAAQAQPPDLVLLDVHLPGCDGFEVCRSIRSTESPDARATVVMLTASRDLASKLLAFSVGADDYLIKPLDVRELRSRVLRWLDNRASLRDRIMRRRQEAIQEIVVAICHEVNNPLTVAMIGVDLVLARCASDAETQTDLQTVRDHLLRIDEVLKTLRSVEDQTVAYIGDERMIDITGPGPKAE